MHACMGGLYASWLYCCLTMEAVLTEVKGQGGGVREQRAWWSEAGIYAMLFETPNKCIPPIRPYVASGARLNTETHGSDPRFRLYILGSRYTYTGILCIRKSYTYGNKNLKTVALVPPSIVDTPRDQCRTTNPKRVQLPNPPHFPMHRRSRRLYNFPFFHSRPYSCLYI